MSILNIENLTTPQKIQLRHKRGNFRESAIAFKTKRNPPVKNERADLGRFF